MAMATDDLESILVILEGAAAADNVEEKISALARLTAAIDPADESYETQRAAAERVLPRPLLALLDDDVPAVRAAAATCLAALTEHAGPARDRVEAAAFASTVEKASLNPVQALAGELEGAFASLATLRFGDDEAAAAAATEAIAALTALNRPNTIALMHEYVKRLTAGEARALSALDDLTVGLDVRDDAAVLLDQALTPALGFLRSGADDERVAAVALLGSIAEARRGAAAYLVAEGALAAAAAMLVDGDLAARDAAAHLAWVLVKDSRALLSPERDALGVPGVRLVEPLVELIERGEAGPADADGDGEADPGQPLAVDNGDSALLLLRALSAQDGEVEARLKGAGGLIAARSCAVM